MEGKGESFFENQAGYNNFFRSMEKLTVEYYNYHNYIRWLTFAVPSFLAAEQNNLQTNKIRFANL